MNLHRLSNSAIPMERPDLERLLHALTSMQEVSGLAAAIILDRLNETDGDPDLEDNNDREASDGDDRDCAWIEWDKMAPTLKGIHNIMGVNDEDAEEDDPSGQSDEDGANTCIVSFGWGGPRGAGCPISDPGGTDLGGE